MAKTSTLLVAVLWLLSAPAAAAPESAPASGPETGEKPEGEEAESAALARAVQNPVADLISVPFQNNVDYNIGSFDRSMWTLDIEPVIPLHVTEDWMVITRTIIPFIYQPNINAAGGGSSGMGDINPTFFVSPVHAKLFIWGFGPTFLFPTATQATTGTGKWGIGPAAVGLLQTKQWTVGALANNIWSYAGQSNRATVNQFLLQYFVNYNLPDAWYLTSSPIITANWEASSGNKWLVPFGAGVGKIFRLGKLPLNGQVQGFFNPIRPDQPPSATWELRFQVAFLFPTAKPKAAQAAASSSCPDVASR
ncbi:MAG TPA: hypothetical protein VMJ30_09160 [Gemmatimonadales bacterium]|nr:hypothetical protein [Gemmatimonadales bacterium]